MHNNLEREGFESIKKIFGIDLSFEQLVKELESTPENKLLIALSRNILIFLGISAKLGEELEQKAYLKMPPKMFLETLIQEADQKIQSDPELLKQLKDIGNNLTEMFQSVDFHKYLFSNPMGNEFEDLIKRRFLEELGRAERISKNAVVKSFKLALEHVKRQQSPDKLFRLSSLNRLGIHPENLKADTTINFIMSVLEMMITKKQELFSLSDDEIEDNLKEFIIRLGRAIEPYLKAIIVSIYNLQKVFKRERFDNFKKGFGYYLNLRRGLLINRSDTEDYIDYRNTIKHDIGFDVVFDRELGKITIIFNLQRELKGKIYWSKTVEMELNEFETLFRDFRKFQNSFFIFYEVYIKSIEKGYEYLFSPFKDIFN